MATPSDLGEGVSRTCPRLSPPESASAVSGFFDGFHRSPILGTGGLKCFLPIPAKTHSPQFWGKLRSPKSASGKSVVPTVRFLLPEFQRLCTK